MCFLRLHLSQQWVFFRFALCSGFLDTGSSTASLDNRPWAVLPRLKFPSFSPTLFLKCGLHRDRRRHMFDNPGRREVLLARSMLRTWRQQEHSICIYVYICIYYYFYIYVVTSASSFTIEVSHIFRSSNCDKIFSLLCEVSIITVQCILFYSLCTCIYSVYQATCWDRRSYLVYYYINEYVVSVRRIFKRYNFVYFVVSILDNHCTFRSLLRACICTT